MKRRKLIAITSVAALVLVIAISRLLDRPPAVMTSVPEPGSEALSQLFGSADGGPDAPDGSGDDTGVVTGASIAGQVLLPTGEPAAGATVTAASPGDPDPHVATTDGGGMFAFAELPDGVYVVEAGLAGYGPALGLGVRIGQTRLRLVLQSGREVSGLVMQDEAPVPNAVIHVGGPGMFPQRAVVADSRGRFVLAGLRPGHYEMLATAPNLGSGFGGRITIDDAEGESLRLDVPVYRAATTRLELVDGATGDPVVSGVVTIAEGPLHVLAVNSTADGGELAIDYLPRGEYHVRVRSPGYLAWDGPLAVSGSDSTVRIALSTGATIRGAVRDSVGNPLAIVSLTAVVVTDEGARWELRQSLFDDFHRLVRPDGTPFWMPSPIYRTDTDGTYMLSGLPTGSARVIASRPGWATAVSNEIQLDADRVYEPLNLTMMQGRRLRGRIEDAGGGAVAGALVSARPPSVPGWASPVGVTTAGVGVFEMEDLPETVILTVRHPDFAMTELRLDIPEQGLDDVVVRLSGEQVAAVSGRVFTTTGRPAVGAIVWLMAGSSALPVCQATVGADGWFRAGHCSSVPERLIASYEGHAPLQAELANTEPRDWVLPLGGELELLTRGTPVVITVEPLSALPAAHWPRPQVSMDSWSRDLVSSVPAGSYRVRCSAEGFDDGVVDVVVTDGHRTEAVCPNVARMVEFPLAVVDPQGAPVAGAVVFVDRVDPPLRAITDAHGRVSVRSRPGVWLNAEAMHERWGRGFLRFYAHYEPRTDPPRIVLEEPIGGDAPDALVEQLAAWGVGAVADGNSLVVTSVADRMPASGTGIRPRDLLLWARPTGEFRYSVGVRRDADLLTFEFVREPDGQ